MAHYGTSPLASPPTGSELKHRRDRRREAVEAAPASDLIIPEEPLLSLAVDRAPKHLADMAKACGLPEGPELEKFIACITPRFRAGLLACPPADLLTERPRAGRPGANSELQAIVIYEFFRQIGAAPKGTKLNALYVVVAKTLGPGLDRNHIRRVVTPFLQRMARTPPEIQNLVLRAVVVLGRPVDEIERPPRRRA